MKRYPLPKQVGLLLGPVLFLIIFFLPIELVSEKGDLVIAVSLWMITWWITEAVSISVTALLPLVLFPLLKIMPIAEVGANYGSPIIFLFFGGFVLALAIEKVNLHKRIALSIIKLTGTTPNKVVLGFMIATASMSMWISNTASTVVMLPIAMSVIHLLINDEDGFTKNDRNFALSVMLGIAFSANAGGIATVIGTPPNSVLIGLLENEYNIEISFLKWMTFGLPFSIIMVTISYFILVKVMFPNTNLKFAASKQLFDDELNKLGSVTSKEKRVLLIFGVAVFLWIFRTVINRFVPSLGLSDTIISILAAISLFATPYNLNKGEFIIKWEDTQKLAWGILILFGLMSNVALVAVLAPVMAGIAIGLEVPILYLLIPVTMASSCAFMLPMATPPNAIVFASGYIKVKDMVRAGFLLNIIAVVLLTGFFVYVMPLIF